MHLRWRNLTTPLGFVAIVGLANGCKSETPIDNPPPPPPEGPPITSVTKAAQTGTAFYSPFDGAPSPTADKIYFTALTEEGVPGVFGVDTAGGEPTKLHAGSPLQGPFSLVTSFDGSTIFVSDVSGEADTDEETEAVPVRGRIFAMPAGGGTPTALAASENASPRSLDLVQENGSDVLYFTGLDETGAPAIFKMDTAGTSKTKVFAGEPLSDPSGIAVAANGTVYVADSEAKPNGTGGVVKIENGTATVIVTDLKLGFPAGIALELDGSALYVSAFSDEDSTAIVHRVVLADLSVVSFNQGIEGNTESAGLHRAHSANTYAWANAQGSIAKPQGGAVYMLKGR
jgi:sugar lactone lactonase YvrE